MPDVTYTRPSLTPAQLANAYNVATSARHKSTGDLINLIIMLSVEQARLWMEVNDHRAKLGIAPLPWIIQERG
jgi:hypothetical protein